MNKKYPLLDGEFLETRREIVESLFLELIDVFYEEVPKMIECLKTCLAKKDLANLRLLGHKLNGMCLNVGAMHLSELGRKIEEENFSEPFSGITELIQEMEAVFLNTKQEVERFKASKIIRTT